MARGMGGRYGMDQGNNPARTSFSPLASAPTSPRVGPSTSAAPNAMGGRDLGDRPLPAIRDAATPTYGSMSAGAVTSSNRIG